MERVPWRNIISSMWYNNVKVYNTADSTPESLLIDVRPNEQYKITSLEKFVHLPYADFMQMTQEEFVSKNVSKDKKSKNSIFQGDV